MTDAERLEWACGVLNRERHDGSNAWKFGKSMVYEAELEQGFNLMGAIAIALALDEQARRKLPDPDQIDWACSVLNRRRHGGHARWNTMKGYDGWLVFHLNREYSFFDALAIAESLIRREMLGDTSDASPKEVSQ